MGYISERSGTWPRWPVLLLLAGLVSSPFFVPFSFLVVIHLLSKIIVHRIDHHHHHYQLITNIIIIIIVIDCHCHCHCQYTIIAGSRASGFIWFDFHSFLFACVSICLKEMPASVSSFFSLAHVQYIFIHIGHGWAVGCGCTKDVGIYIYSGKKGQKNDKTLLTHDVYVLSESMHCY
ncbi:hypothetical protein ASPBRDRAFT_303827 [Aspergillus brasiliensis CBS 101740]|uniref:Uncharacterized protein n=1 Tax=Aspergillus brasiliensis (strain CBS 101740 / IMI 381727 / IBT 21946) TaxID=767769 RepID=A0A1L9UA05_ASPBC|nr:hypothetical protein ASPBRDRAFT_303827 [Aspergillus brasiliensis CBS 101740]